MTVIVADAAIAGDVAPRGVDAAGEFRKVGIHAGVDDPDLDALAGRAGIVRRDRVRIDRVVDR